MRRRRIPLRGAVATAALALLAGLGVGLAADGFLEPPEVEIPSYEYDGRFTFARIKFDPSEWGFGQYTWGLDLKWNHDYPQAEQNFTRILQELTGVEPRVTSGNVLELSDPRLFEHPWAYLCEPGFWNPSDEDARLLREYLLKGGFLMIDDFFDQPGWSPQWDNFERQIQRVLPGVTLYPLTAEHPVFRAFFELDDIQFDDPALRGWFTPKIYGIFEENDPEKRLMVVVNYNMDIGDYWEWSDMGTVYPVHMTEKGFKVGVNYVLYGLTH